MVEMYFSDRSSMFDRQAFEGGGGGVTEATDVVTLEGAENTVGGLMARTLDCLKMPQTKAAR